MKSTFINTPALLTFGGTFVVFFEDGKMIFLRLNDENKDLFLALSKKGIAASGNPSPAKSLHEEISNYWTDADFAEIVAPTFWISKRKDWNELTPQESFLLEDLDGDRIETALTNKEWPANFEATGYLIQLCPAGILCIPFV